MPVWQPVNWHALPPALATFWSERHLCVLSTVGRADGAGPAFDADYWVDNLRTPVRFSEAVSTAAAEHANFVEMSPHPLLTYAIEDTLRTSSTDEFLVTSALKRVEDETLHFRAQLAALGVLAPHIHQGAIADIPSAPWQHSSHWIEDRSSNHRVPDFHPLLGAHIELLSGRDHLWQVDIATETMPWLAGHQTHGHTIVSAESFAEMALAAGCEALGLPADAVVVKELIVEQPLTLDGRAQVTTQLSGGDDGGSQVEIHARSAGGQWRRHAVARVEVSGPAERFEPQPTPGSSETDIAVADGADHPGYRIHPALLDAAIQRLIASAHSPGDATAPAYLPVSLASVRVFGKAGLRARCRTELAAGTDDPSVRLGRIVLTDDSGTAVAELAGVELRRSDPGTVALPLEQKIFDTAWEEVQALPAADSDIATAPAGTWLLLTEDTGAETTTAETAAQVQDFVARFSSPTRRVISADLSDQSAVLAAIADTAGNRQLPAAGIIVFVGKRSFDGTDPDGALRRAQALVLSIAAVARAAVDQFPTPPPRLWLLTRDGLSVNADEPGDPAVGALKGLIRNWRYPGEAARVLAGEPDVGATLVDVDGMADPVATFATDLASPANDDVIAWRAGRRYVERLTRTTAEPGDHGSAVIRADGSYLITGGLGGLGMVVARWLVAGGAGRLVLNGHTEPTEVQRSALAELADGAEIVFVPGDIAAAGVAERLVAAAGETGRPLRGVVHAAGITGDGIVAAVSEDEVARVWAPKVAGALRLHKATAGSDLDWWVGFSSMASLLGLPGQLAYTTANAWLDGLAAWRRASGLPATAIGWGQWSDVGMSRALTYSLLDPITPAEGTEALASLVGGSLTRVGVGRMRLDRAIATNPEFRELGYFERVVEDFDATTDDRPATDEPNPTAAPVLDWSQIPAGDRAGELASRIQAILAHELRMPASAVDVDRPFPELGLDSMMAMAVLKETQKSAGLDLSASMLWNHPTVSLLATYLADLLAPPQPEETDRYGNDDDLTFDPADSVLDELFGSVESVSARSESGGL